MSHLNYVEFWTKKKQLLIIRSSPRRDFLPFHSDRLDIIVLSGLTFSIFENALNKLGSVITLDWKIKCLVGQGRYKSQIDIMMNWVVSLTE